MFGWCSEQLRHWSKRGLSPPREEDRKLPLHKLFENLQEFEQTVPASVRCTLYSTIASPAYVYVSLPACCCDNLPWLCGSPVSFLAVCLVQFLPISIHCVIIFFADLLSDMKHVQTI